MRLPSWIVALLTLAFVTFLGCSIPEGQDGAEGDDGKPGIDGRDGEDGVDGHDGAPGKDAVLGFSHCSLIWPGMADTGSYEITYSVMQLKGGVQHVDLAAVYKNAGEVSFSESSAAMLSGSTKVETGGWIGEMTSATEAKITRKAVGQSKTVTCKSETAL